MATWTAADITVLKAAIASGVQTVRYSGPPAREVSYHSLAEMRSLLAEMLAQVDPDDTHRPFRFATVKKGFCE